MTNTIGFSTDKQRYEIRVDGTLAGFSEVRETEQTVTFIHTVVFDEFGGQGIAGELVTEALDDVRTRGKKVVAECEYVAGFIDKHPDYAELVA